MSLNSILFVIMNGLTYGALLFMCAAGFTLVYGLMRVVNMAHGSFYLFGSFMSYMVLKWTGNWYLAILGGAVSVGILAFLVKTTLYARAFGNSMHGTLLTLGLSYVIIDSCLAIFGAQPMNIKADPAIDRGINIGFMTYPGVRLFILLIAVIEAILLYYLIKKTRLGQLVRAGVDDKEMVMALGININRIFTAVFVMAGILVGIGGALGGSFQSFQVGSTEGNIQIYSLMVVIIGGQGSLAGAAIGALLIGLVDSFTKAFIPDISTVVVFAVMMFVLAFRPQGILGKAGRQR